MPAALLPLGSVDVVQAFRDNDTFGHICLFAILLLSIYSFSIIFMKFRAIRRAFVQNEEFQALVDSDGSWEKLFMASKEYEDAPSARLLKETYVECRMENWFEQRGDIEMEHRLDIAKATVEGVLQRTMATEESRLLDKVGILSTVSTLGPFIGLLGTVWGVLASFQAIGQEGSASLSTLAPGISTALLTTIFGLFAAIPALVAYNYFMTSIHHITNRMESFSHELENAVRKQILLSGRAK